MAEDIKISPLDIDAAPTDESQAGVSAITPESLIGAIDGESQASVIGTEIRAGALADTVGATTDEVMHQRGKLEYDQRAALHTAAMNSYAAIEMQLAGATVAQVEANPAEAEPAAENLNAGMTAINEQRASVLAVEIATITNAASIPLEHDVKMRLAANLAMRGDVAQIMEDSGIADTVLNFAGAMATARDTMEWEDVKRGVSQHEVLRQYISGESIAGMIESWSALPLARQVELWPILKQVVIDASGLSIPYTDIKITDSNALLASSMLIRFLEPEGGFRASAEQKTFLALDAIPLVGTGLKLASRTAKTAKILSDFERTAKAAEKAGRVAKVPKKQKQQMEFVLRSAMNKVVQETNIIKLLAEGGDIKQAVKINLKALDSEVVRKGVHITSDDIIRNMLPEQTGEWFPSVVFSGHKNMIAESAKQINEFLSKAQGFVRSMTSESSLLSIGALPKSARRHQVKSFLKELEQTGEDFLLEGITLTKTRITKQLEDGFEFEYTLTNSATKEVTEHTGNRSWRIDANTGHFMETVNHLAANTKVAGTSPSFWAADGKLGQLDFGDAVKQAIQLEDVAVATKQRINELWLDANRDTSGMNFRARARIENVERAGNTYINGDAQEKGRVFTPKELYAGVRTPAGTVYLTEAKEVRAYYKRRLVADAFHAMQNYVSRREYELAGFKATTVKTIAGDVDLMLKPFDTIARANQSLLNKKGFAAFHAGEGRTHTITEKTLTDEYAKGNVLARLRNKDWNPSGNPMMNSKDTWHVEYVFVPKHSIRALPEQVVNYRKGYVPDIYEGAEFVVKQSWGVQKAGTKGSSVTKAVRAFASRTEALRFIDELAANLAKEKDIPLEQALKSFDIGDGSVMGQMERMENALSGTAGLFTGQRAEQDMLIGLQGTAMDKMSPSEAYGRYIDSLGTKLSKNEWRIGKEKEWMNTAKELDINTSLGFNGTPLVKGNPQHDALAKMRDQINKWNVVPSRQESLAEGFVQGFHDWMLNAGKKTGVLGIEKNAIKSIMYMKHSNPAAAMMTASMHLMLGALNPAQLVVQGSAATIALSLMPIRKIPNLVPSVARFALMDNIKSGNARGKIYKLFVKNPGVSWDKDTTNMYRLWRRSGLAESIRSNADMGYMSSTGLGMTSEFLRRAGNGSLMIYREGELFNRRVSFIGAYHSMRKLHPKAKQDDAFLGLVLKRANMTMLELNGANKAWWQGGNGATGVQRMAAMMTQFYQVLTHTVEAVVKPASRGGFTVFQKARIGTGQYFFFGSAGIPFMKAVGGWLTQAVSEIAGLDPETDGASIERVANVFNQMLIGITAWEIMGSKVDVATRVSVAHGALEGVYDILTSDDPIWLKVMGVSGETGKRVAQFIKDTTAVVAPVIAGALAEEPNPILEGEMAGAIRKMMPLSLADRTGYIDLTPEMVKAVIADVALLSLNIATSSRNIIKASMMQGHHRVIDRRGNTKIIRDYNEATVLGAASGFALSDETRLRHVMKDNRDFKEQIKASADLITAAYHRWIYAHGARDAYANTLSNMIQYQQEQLANPYEVAQLAKLLKSRIYDQPQTQEQREVHAWLLRQGQEAQQGAIMDKGALYDPDTYLTPTVVPAADFGEEGSSPFTRGLEQDNSIVRQDITEEDE